MLIVLFLYLTSIRKGFEFKWAGITGSLVLGFELCFTSLLVKAENFRLVFVSGVGAGRGVFVVEDFEPLEKDLLSPLREIKTFPRVF